MYSRIATPLQRRARGVLAAWLCVVLVSVLSPWAHARMHRAVAPDVWLPQQVAQSLCGTHDAADTADTADTAGSVHAERHKPVQSAAHGPSAQEASGHDPLAAHAWHGLDCPLCLPVLAPPWADVAVAATAPAPQGKRVVALPAHGVHRSAAPLPARGPPSILSSGRFGA